ncbi:MAG: hypothetical protein RLZZ301_1498 [Bacteroidota bacterium]
MKKLIYFFILLLGVLSACIEISDDLTLHNDGTGTLKYKINLSPSKVKINSILALDSLDGKKVPSTADISEKIKEFVKILDAQSGISNVLIEENYTDYIFKFSCDFASISQLQNGLRQSIELISKEKLGPEADENWLFWDGNKLKRSIPSYVEAKIKSYKHEDLELLKEGSYTTITRFDRPIQSAENSLSTISKNQLAVMIKANAFSVKENQSLLENTIVLTPR